MAPTHHHYEQDWASGDTPGPAACGGTLVDRGDTLVCGACGAETHRRCTDYEECGSDWLTLDEVTLGYNGQPYCDPCREVDLQNASAIVRLGPDAEPEGADRIRFGNTHADVDDLPDWFTALFPDGKPARHYHRSDAGRGYYDTPKIMVGVTSIAEGWVTGDYDDVAYKADTHRLANVLNEHRPPVDVFVLTEPTSNVFSTAAEILVADGDIDAAWAYLTEHGFTPEGLQAAFH